MTKPDPESDGDAGPQILPDGTSVNIAWGNRSVKTQRGWYWSIPGSRNAGPFLTSRAALEDAYQASKAGSQTTAELLREAKIEHRRVRGETRTIHQNLLHRLIAEIERLQAGNRPSTEKPMPTGTDEPVFWLRAKDDAALHALMIYGSRCRQIGSSVEHLAKVRAVTREFERWRDENPEKCKVPD